MDSERNVAAKKTVSRPLQESSLQVNVHDGNVQNSALQTADSEMEIGILNFGILNCKMTTHPNTIMQETAAATTLQDTAIIDAQDGHTPEQETNPSSSGVMVLNKLEIAVIR